MVLREAFSFRSKVTTASWGAGKLGQDLDELTHAVNGVIARRVKAERASLGIGLAELAELSGVPLATLIGVEHERAGCTAVELWKISLALDVSVTDLCTPSRDQNPLGRLYELLRDGLRRPGARCLLSSRNSSVILRSSRQIH